MALKEIYQRFLDLPNPISLSENASFHYITTLTTLSQPAAIVKHLETQNKKVVETKSTRIISVVEGVNSLALEIETVLEFISGGGAYLPGLENFIVDKIATIPVTHIVYFDADRRISQIRISWDQGSLLKQAEVIGSRGRNWPVFDGKDQVRLINSGASSAPVAAPQLPSSPRGRSDNQSIASSRNVSPSKRHIKDPYASLDLFSPRAVDENQPFAAPNAVAPRASARPPPREMSELFAAGHEDHEPGSPKKVPVEPVVASKGAASQKFGAPRLFADDPNEAAAVGYKSNPAKYNHFDLGEADEYDPMQHRDGAPKPTAAVPMRPKTTKHESQWDFQDFSTPDKVGQRLRGQDVVHFSLGNAGEDMETPAKKAAPKPRRDNESHFELQDDGTPVQRHVVPKARKDAESHFEFKDTATPVPSRTSGRPTSSAGDRMGLYTNNLYSEDEEDVQPRGKGPLATITNNASRKNNLDSHWSMSGSSPAADKANNENTNTQAADHRTKASKMMESHWDNDAPEQVKKAPTHNRLRKGMESHWSMGGEGISTTTTTGQGQAQKSFWDF